MPVYLSSLFSSGALTGTLLDGIHSRTGLQIYQVLPFTNGGLQSSLVVPPLLGLFYISLGLLFWLGDGVAAGSESTKKVQARCQDVLYVALCFGVLAASLQLSAYLYETGTPFGQISLALAAVSAASWLLLDGTLQGLVLAAVCAVGAPAAELVLLRLVPLWSYPRADLDLGEWGSFVSWVPWCYFFYTPALGALSRYLVQISAPIAPQPPPGGLEGPK